MDNFKNLQFENQHAFKNVLIFLKNFNFVAFLSFFKLYLVNFFSKQIGCS